MGRRAVDIDRSDSFGQFAVLPTETVAIRGLHSAKHRAIVTLPGRSTTDEKRRDPEVALPRELKKADFFGMMNDCLIYSSLKNESLVLLLVNLRLVQGKWAAVLKDKTVHNSWSSH